MSWMIATANDIGTRGEQQDRVSIITSPRTGAHLVVMADGMGGHAEGAEAAQKVVDTAGDAFRDGDIASPRTFLEQVCRDADRHIRAQGARNGSGRAPGSTCTLLYLVGDEAYWMHVGDSRLYHFSEDGLCNRTRDHTVAALVDQNGANQALPAGTENGLYMCLGGENELAPMFGASALGARDWFMLCTDGFWSQVRPFEVVRSIEDAGSLDECAERLVALARRRGRSDCDNITLALVRRRPGRRWWPRSPRFPRRSRT